MSDLLTDALPTEWEGRSIDPDFRIIVRLLNAARRAETDEDRAQMVCTAVESFYRDPMSTEDLPEAFGALVRFSEGGADDSTGVSHDSSPTDALSMDYHCDAPYIAAAFQQAYGIDLTVEKVHWWRFRALLRGLPEDTRYASILTVRSKDTSRMEGDELAYWETLKDLYALPENLQGGGGRPEPETLQDHEDAFLARF